MAAGFGKRLRPLTYIKAKPAIPFLGKPLIHYSLDLLSSVGVGEIAVNLHYLPETVKPLLKSRSEKILLSREKKILGTGGCLRKLRRFFSNSTIIMANGKIFFSEANLESALRDHEDSKSMVTMVLVPFEEGMPYKKVFLDQDRNIVAFSRNISSEDKLRELAGGKLTEPFVFTGIQILNSSIIDYIPKGYSDSVADIYPEIIRLGMPLRGHISHGFWRECSTPERYLQASLDVMARSEFGSLEQEDRSTDGIFTEDSVKIPDSTRMRNCIIWEGSQIGRESSFEDVIIAGTPSSLPDRMEVKNAVITPLLTDISEELPLETTVGPDFMIWPMPATTS